MQEEEEDNDELSAISWASPHDQTISSSSSSSLSASSSSSSSSSSSPLLPSTTYLSDVFFFFFFLRSYSFFFFFGIPLQVTCNEVSSAACPTPTTNQYYPFAMSATVLFLCEVLTLAATSQLQRGTSSCKHCGLLISMRLIFLNLAKK
jgi:hypothetical protein